MDPKTIKEILDEVSNTESLSTKISKLKDYANNLEKEIKNMKIFKFTLPITIVNLSDGLLFCFLGSEVLKSKKPKLVA
ncbi:hypothetical protein ACJIZ3_024248 [Penstemon smallii]|uniref:HHO5-like N-terminal domain-containing protein n=1 Tax=Penstemon smallii TaxID=265156 RepID=A0ABD3TRA5_9LAMI